MVCGEISMKLFVKLYKITLKWVIAWVSNAICVINKLICCIYDIIYYAVFKIVLLMNGFIKYGWDYLIAHKYVLFWMFQWYIGEIKLWFE